VTEASERDRPAKVLFVCTANVCRSPLAEAIFNVLAAEANVPWRSCSAGVAALAGEPIAPRAEAVLEELGISARGHRARQVDKAMLDEADLVLTMTPQHAAEVNRISTGSSPKVHTLLGYAHGASDHESIPDPYGQSVAVHRMAAHQLLYHLQRTVERLGDGR